MTLTHPARAAIATGLAIAASFAAMTATAAAQLTIEPEPVPQPSLPTIISPCSQIASISPASAQPGQDVDIHITPPSGRAYLFAYSVAGVLQFANGVPTTFTNVAPHSVADRTVAVDEHRPVAGDLPDALTGGTWNIASSTAFTPISFGNTLNPSSATLYVGNSTNVTATLSHPAPAPITLTLAPQSNALSVRGLAPGVSSTVTIPAGAQSASFSVGAHAPSGTATVVVSGPNVTSATLTVNVPTPGFSISVPNNDAEVHWGDSGTYAVQLTSTNGFAGTIDLSATGLPFGATAAPVSVTVPANGSANATFTVATAQAATALGTDGRLALGAEPVLEHDPIARPAGPAGYRQFRRPRLAHDRLDVRHFEADVNGTANANVTFDGPGFSPQSHSHLRYAWTPDCRGAVVMGTATAANGGVPVSIFNFGFDTAIADGPGSRHNLGTAAWHHGHFKVSPDGSFVIAVAQSNTFNASLFDMLSLSRRGVTDSYTITETLSASIAGDEVHAVPSGSSNDWTWTLP